MKYLKLLVAFFLCVLFISVPTVYSEENLETFNNELTELTELTSEPSEQHELLQAFEAVYNQGYYLRSSDLKWNGGSVKEATYFHDNWLWFSSNSGYAGDSGMQNPTSRFKIVDGVQQTDYTINNGDITFYTLASFVDETNFNAAGWHWNSERNAWESTKNLEMGLGFIAPCFTGEGVSLTNVSVQILYDGNLEFTLYAENDVVVAVTTVCSMTSADIISAAGINVHAECGALVVNTSHTSGFYSESFLLSLTTCSNATIYYTLDSSTPNENSNKYVGAIEISDISANPNLYASQEGISSLNVFVPTDPVDKCVVIKAIAIDNDGNKSDVICETFFVGYESKEGYDNIPIISLVIDPDDLYNYDRGIYVTGKLYDEGEHVGYPEQYPANYQQKGKEWERVAEFTYFDEYKAFSFSQTIGVRIHGGWSRAFNQKSFNLYARKEYSGTKTFEEPFFDTVKLQSCMLRSGGYRDTFATKVRDSLNHELSQNESFSVQNSYPVVVFLNGEYWGIYLLQERFTEHYVEEHYGVDKDNVIIIENGEVDEGEGEDILLYEELVSFFKNNDFSAPEMYELAKQYIDVSEFAAYMSTELYIGNIDWPGNNVRMWRVRVTSDQPYEDGKWRFMMYDTDDSADMLLSKCHYDTDPFLNANHWKDGPLDEDCVLGLMLSKLLCNEEFAELFRDTFIRIASENFSMENVNSYLDNVIAQLAEPMSLFYQRFVSNDTETYNEEYYIALVEIIRTFFENRYDYAIEYLNQHVPVTLKFECEICEQERYSDVEYHSHVFDTWTPLMGDYYPMHESTCTVPGCGASTESYCSDSYSEEFHVSMTTLRKNCTKCGQYTEREIDSSAVEITHVEAKPATCGEVGNTEFWICGHCNQYFSDASCQHVVTPAQVYISPSEHTYVNNVCSVCESEIKSARFEQSMDDTFNSDDCYLYVLIGVGSDGKLYAMGEATADGRRYGVEIPSAQIDANGIVTLNAGQAEFMDFEYYFENGSGATTTSTFMVDGNYMTARYGKIYTFPQDRLDDKNNPRPFSFRLESYSGESSLGYVDCDLYDPSNYSHTHEYITFNPETHYFEACEDRQYTVYLYRQVCDHEDIYLTHSTPVAPTCTEQGFSGDYWECTMCGKVFTDSTCSTEMELPEDIYFLSPALGHDFNAGGVCENCGMNRHVYTQVSTLAEFDALTEDASYIIVFKDGNKTYAAYIPDWNIFNKMITADSDGDGLIDLLEPDANANGIPDIVEDYIDTQWGGADEDEDGTTTADEYKQAIGSLDDDDDVDVEDYKQFFAWHIEYLLSEEFEEEHATNHPNVVEVPVAADGSITITDEGAMEFQMMLSGIWGGQEYDDSELEYEGIKETDRLRAAWVPNRWVANYGTMGRYSEEHFLTQNRWFGDHFAPGVIDNKNWRISFNGDGTAMLVSTWTDFDDSAALQLVKYTDADGNERVTMVGCYGELWQYSDILSNCTVISGAYLYASEPVYAKPPHECIWSDWKDDDVTDTHTRKCTVEGCDNKQTEDHNWDNGVQTEAPACTEAGTTTYTCPDCRATKTEPIPALDHDWSDWTYDSVDSHTRYCKRECGIEQEIGGHEWGDWVPVDDTTHKMVCDLCKGDQTGEHDWDDGVITKEPTEWEEGVTTYTCVDCSHTKTEPFGKLEHECTWTDWYPNGDENHKRDCMDDNCDKFETLPHEWDNGEITKEPTCKEIGVKTFTCMTCQHTRTEDVPIIDHVFGDWTPNNDGTTHSRYCSCNESETADHKFDDGEVTQAPTHEAIGEIKYTCTDCEYFYTEDIPALTDHEWGEWVINKLDEANTHIRYCICNESQTAPHNFDEGKVTTEATHTSKGVMTFTCTDDCGYSYTEEIPETAGHEWTDWRPNDDKTHTRSCRCNANETDPCEWNNGVVTAPTCEEEGTTVYTCTVCGNTKTDTTPALGHDWSDWKDTGANAVADIHERSCQRDGCDAKETGNHEWSNLTSTGSTEHKKTCSVCKGERTSTHAWDNGEVTKEATVKEPGVTTYACSDCGATKTEVISKIVCDHTWGKWEAENDETHKHTCVNGNGCEAFQRQAHEWNEGVITTAPTETTEGIRTYTCLVCSHTKTESIAMLEHTHSFGSWVSDGEDTHTRRCENGNTCTANETENHTCNAWANNDNGTHSGKCSVCGAEMTKAHIWSDWAVQDGGSLKRTCTAECGAFEEMPVLQPISYSVVNTTSEENAASAELKDNSVALFNSVLTEEEQSAVASGATVSVYLEVRDIPANEVTSSDKAAAEAVITEEDNALDENTEIGMYLDIELFKEVTDNNTTEETQITETSNKVTITIAIPDELINTNSSIDRTYRIIRVHEDENGNLITDVIEGTFDSNAKTFTFESDKFSTYALAYNDTERAVEPITYTIIFNANGGSVTPASARTNVEGKLASLPTPTRSGSYTFNGWYTAASGGTKVTTFTVFTADTTIYAQWTYTGSSGIVIPAVFSVTVKDSDNGEVKVNATYSVPGSIVKLIVTPDEGYELDALTAKIANKEVEITLKDGKYQFIMPYGSVNVTATFKKIETPIVPDPVVLSFDDVADDTYYFDAVLWAVENGITTGTSDTTFSPDMTCTRAQAVTFLWRVAGSPEPKSNTMPFEDIAAEAYYYKAVLWALENGITNGTSDTTFSPDMSCTRAQIVTFLWRAQKSPAITAVNPFADIAADAYYFDAILWAVDEKITNGTSETTFSPAAKCTRAQIVTFLYRAMGDEK